VPGDNAKESRRGPRKRRRANWQVSEAGAAIVARNSARSASAVFLYIYIYNIALLFRVRFFVRPTITDHREKTRNDRRIIKRSVTY